MIHRNDLCWCGSQKKWKKCHYPKINKNMSEYYLKTYEIILKTPEQIEKIRKACHVAAMILDELVRKAKPEVTTNELNAFAESLHQHYQAIAAPLGYGHPPFPKSICTSINEVICHGIPNDTALKEGDILNIDVTSIVDGYYGDCSRMVIVGEKTTKDREKVVEVSYECLMSSIDILKPGVMLSEIGKIIEKIAKNHHFSVVHQFVGHGVGLSFHEPPQIPHYSNELAIPLASGMVFTIEPMINVGVAEAVIDPLDGWTARTKDLKPSAQWEHTLLITDDGHEILTLL